MEHAERLDHIFFADQGEERTGQVMAGPFTVPDTSPHYCTSTYYYVVEPNGEELLVNHDNLVETQWTP